MKYIFILLLIVSHSASAETYKSETSQLVINSDSIILNGTKYGLNEELITEAYAVGTFSLMNGDSTSCRITTNIAQWGKDGSLMLVSAKMAKRSNSQGLLCWAVRNSSSFRAPHVYRYTKVDISEDKSTVRLNQLIVSDGIGRPIIQLEDLLDEDLLLREDLISYAKSSSRVRFKTEVLSK